MSDTTDHCAHENMKQTPIVVNPFGSIHSAISGSGDRNLANVLLEATGKLFEKVSTADKERIAFAGHSMGAKVRPTRTRQTRHSGDLSQSEDQPLVDCHPSWHGEGRPEASHRTLTARRQRYTADGQRQGGRHRRYRSAKELPRRANPARRQRQQT